MTHPTINRGQAAVAPIHTSVIRDNFIGDDELLADLIDAFRGHAPQLLADIQRGLETRDGTLVQRAAHTLKGSTGIFGTTIAYDAAVELEAAARSGALDRAAAVFELLRTSHDQLNAAFDQILRTGH